MVLLSLLKFPQCGCNYLLILVKCEAPAKAFHVIHDRNFEGFSLGKKIICSVYFVALIEVFLVTLLYK